MHLLTFKGGYEFTGTYNQFTGLPFPIFKAVAMSDCSPHNDENRRRWQR